MIEFINERTGEVVATDIDPCQFHIVDLAKEYARSNGEDIVIRWRDGGGYEEEADTLISYSDSAEQWGTK
jgi:hypothetical protein